MRHIRMKYCPQTYSIQTHLFTDRRMEQSFGFRERQIRELRGDYKGFPDLA